MKKRAEVDTQVGAKKSLSNSEEGSDKDAPSERAGEENAKCKEERKSCEKAEDGGHRDEEVAEEDIQEGAHGSYKTEPEISSTFKKEESQDSKSYLKKPGEYFEDILKETKDEAEQSMNIGVSIAPKGRLPLPK